MSLYVLNPQKGKIFRDARNARKGRAALARRPRFHARGAPRGVGGPAHSAGTPCPPYPPPGSAPRPARFGGATAGRARGKGDAWACNPLRLFSKCAKTAILSRVVANCCGCLPISAHIPHNTTQTHAANPSAWVGRVQIVRPDRPPISARKGGRIPSCDTLTNFVTMSRAPPRDPASIRVRGGFWRCVEESRRAPWSGRRGGGGVLCPVRGVPARSVRASQRGVFGGVSGRLEAVRRAV